jgi:hypothetical protein
MLLHKVKNMSELKCKAGAITTMMVIWMVMCRIATAVNGRF